MLTSAVTIHASVPQIYRRIVELLLNRMDKQLLESTNANSSAVYSIALE